MKTIVCLATVAMALAVPSPARSQATTPTAPRDPSLRTFFSDLADDVRRLPSNAAGISIAIGSILGASMHPFDDDLAQWDPDPTFAIGNWAGNPFVLAAGSFATYGIGRWRGNRRVEWVAVDLLRAQTLSLGLTYGVKYTVGRERPDRTSGDSFPSGHAAQSFASATILARHFGKKVALPAFGAATFIAVSRVNQRRHYLSDVLFGAGIGIAVGWNGSQRAAAWTVAPSVSRSHLSVQLSRTVAPP